MTKQNNNRSEQGAVILTALFRLALLVGPEVLLIKFTAQSPIVCILAMVAYLALWLSVDVWPFRATRAVATVKPVRPAQVYAQNLSKAQWISHLFCRVILFFMLFHSKLMIS